MSDENNIGMGEEATVTATRLVLLCSKAIEEYRDALREQEYDETGPLTIIPSDFEIARDVVVEFFEERRKTPEPEKNSGNVAALREALENVERVARFCAEMPRHTPGYPTDAERADVLYSRIAELGRVARAALAAPAEGGGAKCIDGLRGHPDCRGCYENCLDVRKRNCFYWNPDIGKCALDGKPSCRIACGNFHVSKEEKPGPEEGAETK